MLLRELRLVAGERGMQIGKSLCVRRFLITHNATRWRDGEMEKMCTDSSLWVAYVEYVVAKWKEVRAEAHVGRVA